MEALCAVAAAAAVAFAALWLAYRRRLRLALGRNPGGPIPTVHLDELDDAFAPGPAGPSLAAEVSFVSASRGVPGGTSDREAWVLATLARGARTMFEFGTATGRTTWLLARNSPPGARVITLTLAPDQTGKYQAAPGDTAAAARAALAESVHRSFLYSGTDVESKVEQLYGDSKELDATPWAGRCDLVFVDGSHAYSYVLNDTAKALEMVAPGGLVLWHDYRDRWATTRDVYRALTQLRASLPLVHLAGTSLVAFRRPPA
jgi:predicted O-methyltransferase YrrM